MRLTILQSNLVKIFNESGICTTSGTIFEIAQAAIHIESHKFLQDYLVFFSPISRSLNVIVNLSFPDILSRKWMFCSRLLWFSSKFTNAKTITDLLVLLFYDRCAMVFAPQQTADGILLLLKLFTSSSDSMKWSTKCLAIIILETAIDYCCYWPASSNCLRL